MSFLKKYRFIAVGAVIILIALGFWAYSAFKTLPENSHFITDQYTFDYPRTFSTHEYAPGVVSIGHYVNGELLPFVDINEYKSDPESARPKTFELFAKLQTEAFCGSDNSLISITCTLASTTAYTSKKGAVGHKMDLTAVRKDLKTGKSTNESYGPIYVFETTPLVPREEGVTERYSGIFIYQSFTAFVIGTSSPELLNSVVDSLELTKI